MTSRKIHLKHKHTNIQPSKESFQVLHTAINYPACKITINALAHMRCSKRLTFTENGQN